mmetsp:Transcript_36531/g.81929  ORF Transcript_36531/g.81929 Transcript_36531/m.81929 type:complete len:247 (+) Transcript_36531:995-1735(+)
MRRGSPLLARSPRNPGPPPTEGSGSRKRRALRAPSRGVGFPPRGRLSYGRHPHDPRVPTSAISRVLSTAFKGIATACMTPRPRGPATWRSRASSTASTTASRARTRPQAWTPHPGRTPPGPLTAGPQPAPAPATPRTRRCQPTRPRVPIAASEGSPRHSPTRVSGRAVHLTPRLASTPPTGPAKLPGLPPSPRLRLLRPLRTTPHPYAGAALLGPRAFEHYPATLLLRRCAEIAFHLDVSPQACRL